MISLNSDFSGMDYHRLVRHHYIVYIGVCRSVGISEEKEEGEFIPSLAVHFAHLQCVLLSGKAGIF